MRTELTKIFVMISNWKKPLISRVYTVKYQGFNPLTAGAAYIRVFIFSQHIKYHLLNTLKIKYVINQ